MKTESEAKAEQLEAITIENVELEEEIRRLSAALEEKESMVAALQGAQEDKLMNEISEIKSMLFQTRSQKEQKEMHKSIVFKDREEMKAFDLQLQTMLSKNGMYDFLYMNCYHSVIFFTDLLTIQSRRRSLHNLEAWRMSFSVPR